MNNKLHVLHINQADNHGGAALAAYRLHQELISQGIDSQLLVGKKYTDDERVETFPQKYKLALISDFLSKTFALNYVFLPKVSLNKIQAFQHANIIHLHNLHGGYLNYRHLPILLRSKKVVMTLHDEWNYTGHCSYTRGCKRFQTGCGKCPFLDTHPAIRWDNTRTEWRLKYRTFKKLKPIIICPSSWIATQARQSLLSEFEIQVIPLGLDLKVFYPIQKHIAKTSLGFKESDFVLGFGSFELNDPRKGGDLLIQALKQLKRDGFGAVKLLLIGKGNAQRWSQETGMDAFSTGYVQDGPLKTLSYSACDTFVVPSREDNFPLMALEAQACGVPVIASQVGGLGDIIEHQVTGLLVDVENLSAWEDALFDLLNNQEKRVSMGIKARQRVENLFDLKLITKKMIELYQGVL